MQRPQTISGSSLNRHLTGEANTGLSHLLLGVQGIEVRGKRCKKHREVGNETAETDGILHLSFMQVYICHQIPIHLEDGVRY